LKKEQLLNQAGPIVQQGDPAGKYTEKRRLGERHIRLRAKKTEKKELPQPVMRRQLKKKTQKGSELARRGFQKKKRNDILTNETPEIIPKQGGDGED